MKHLALLLALTLLTPSAIAQNGASANPDFQSIITQQLQAIAKDDAATAYTQAAPNVQRIFPSPEIFMGMVKGGYAPIYRNKQYNFSESGQDEAGRPYQKVEILGADGVRYTAIYFMERQADGTWKISGVVMAKNTETNV